MRLEEALSASGAFVLSAEEKFLRKVIHQGEDESIDIVCESLQLALKQKGGVVAGYAHAGQQDGILLTRAAFAVMIKFQRLSDKLQQMVLEAEAFFGQGNEIQTVEPGAARNKALLDFYCG